MQTVLAYLTLSFLCLGAGLAASEQEPKKPASQPASQPATQAKIRTIRAYRIGSSSFGPELLEDAKAIIDASGKFVLDWDAKRDSAGYTRLDQFVTQPGSYEEWCAKYLPRIEEGHYDFVVLQTIGWFNFTPEQQEKLLTVILPDMIEKIRKTGAQVILYDKYVALERDEKDPRARAWAGRYPEGIRFNYLLHILAAKKAGVDKITFGGAAVHALWEQEPYKNMGYVFNNTGHPGIMAHYLSACDLSYLMTSLDPVGNPARSIAVSGWIKSAFAKEPANGNQAFYDAWKGQMKGDQFVLTDAQAKALQEAAMKYHREWAATLQTALKDEAEFAKIQAEIRRIQGEALKMEAYGLSAKKAEILRKQFANANAGELNQAQIDKIREKVKAHDFGKLSNNYMPDKEAQKAATKEFVLYWDKNNSKFRDDVLFECALEEARFEAEGNREEAQRLKEARAVLQKIQLLPGYRILLERMNAEQKKQFLTDNPWHGPAKRCTPAFTAYQEKVKGDPDKLYKAWDVYLDVWTDPNLLDKLKDQKFAQEVFLEADKEFEKKISGK